MESSTLKRVCPDAPRVNVLGVGISVINIVSAVRIIENWINRGEQRYVCAVPVSSVMVAQRDESFRHILNSSGLTTPDGMPMVWLGKIHRFREMERVYGPDLMLALCELSARKGYRNFFYGGAEGVAKELTEKMQERYPGLEIAGFFTPPFRSLTPEEDEHVIRIINESHTDILWVGIGSPKQERWMANHAQRLKVPVMLGVGAAFDFHTGRIKEAPRWIHRTGMQWFYRLCKEPKRLWKRYLINNPLFLLKVLLQLTGLRTYSMRI